MEESIPIDDKLVRPVYPYWTLGYVITPKVAKILCNDAIKQNIIPVDEYLPTMMPLVESSCISGKCGHTSIKRCLRFKHIIKKSI